MGLFDFIKKKREGAIQERQINREETIQEQQTNYAEYVETKLYLEKGKPLDSGAPYRQFMMGKLRSFEFETEEEAVKAVESLESKLSRLADSEERYE